ncbi:hypothetical protein B0F90DRAFT_1668421 [Multifurca ochricompacta]|uniref:Uncharacterized protein n=1 Tax=Multifurca ochricompacta TaxID=376703 RepID=A0AAD4M3K5_9AGAM|nr:hypothetical protein B0F90DRAFT_1668421 [Multifurca ochricompacta]
MIGLGWNGGEARQKVVKWRGREGTRLRNDQNDNLNLGWEGQDLGYLHMPEMGNERRKGVPGNVSVKGSHLEMGCERVRGRKSGGGSGMGGVRLYRIEFGPGKEGRGGDNEEDDLGELELGGTLGLSVSEVGVRGSGTVVPLRRVRRRWEIDIEKRSRSRLGKERKENRKKD